MSNPNLTGGCLLWYQPKKNTSTMQWTIQSFRNHRHCASTVCPPVSGSRRWNDVQDGFVGKILKRFLLAGSPCSNPGGGDWNCQSLNKQYSKQLQNKHRSQKKNQARFFSWTNLTWQNVWWNLRFSHTTNPGLAGQGFADGHNVVSLCKRSTSTSNPFGLWDCLHHMISRPGLL